MNTTIASLLATNNIPGIRDSLLNTLAIPGAAVALRSLDQAGLLTRIIPELEPARLCDQPRIHFLPVLAHSLETVESAEWILAQISEIASPALPVAINTFPALCYRSVYVDQLRAHFAGQLGNWPRVALFKLAALLHDVAKPQTKQPKPEGGVSFHEHQTIGAQVAIGVAQQLQLGEAECRYIGVVVREHMRPGQLATLDEVTLRAVRRFFHATGEAGPDLLIHSLADHMATRGPNLQPENWVAQAEWYDSLLDVIWGVEPVLEQPLLNGTDLMATMGLTPGPLVGRLLAAVGVAQADGEITTREQALELVQRLLTR